MLTLPRKLNLTPSQFAEMCAANPEAVLELAADGTLIEMTPTGGSTGARNQTLGALLWLAIEQSRLPLKLFDSSATPGYQQSCPPCPTKSSPWEMPGWRCSSKCCRATSSALPASSWPGPTARSSAKTPRAANSLLMGPRRQVKHYRRWGCTQGRLEPAASAALNATNRA